jgi:hypothetical protein
MKTLLKALWACLITISLAAPAEAWPRGHGGYHAHGAHHHR